MDPGKSAAGTIDGGNEEVALEGGIGVKADRCVRLRAVCDME